MANRFQNPFEQFGDSSIAPYSGGKLNFYLTGTSTRATTYSDNDLETPNTNPVVLNSAGRPDVGIFLDPAVTYKVVLTDAFDNQIWTADPVVDPAANVTAKLQVYAGNPNGNVAGTAGSVGGAGASVIWDITGKLLFVCTTTGDAADAVWTQVAADLSGKLVASSVISPGGLAEDQDDYGPPGIDTAFFVRLTASEEVSITGLDAGNEDGRLLHLHNIGSEDITLKDESEGSEAANRFSLGADLILGNDAGVFIQYDATSSRWRMAASSGRSIASQEQAEAGDDNKTAMTPLRTKQAIDANRAGTDYQVLTETGTWTKPAAATATSRVRVQLWAGGGGGGSSSTGGGGGGGGYKEAWFSAADLGATETVTIGAGGAVATAGGNSTFGSLLTAYGGGGGASGASSGGGGGGGLTSAGSSASSNNGGDGGLPTIGAGNGTGTSGGNNTFGVGRAGGGGAGGGNNGGRGGYGSDWGGGGGGANLSGGLGGDAVWGGAGGAGGSASTQNGKSVFGGDGGIAGGNGVAPGGGGGGNSGLGARGECRVTVFF